MAASYPGAVKSFSVKNSNDVIEASHINDLQDEVTAMENALVGSARINHDLLFTDAQFDIGKAGATRPRDLFTSRHVTVGGNLTVVGTISGLSAAYPVGSIYINADVATNPATLLGFGTWAAFGTGRVMVAIDAGQTEFDTLGETGGAKTHTLSTAEMPVHAHVLNDPTHNHTQNAHNHTQDAHGHTVTQVNSTGAGAVAPLKMNASQTNDTDDFTIPTTVATNQAATATNIAAATGITMNNAGSGSAHNNLQPYIVVHMWRRTA